MKNNQVKITFQDDKQKAVVQITQNGNEVSGCVTQWRNARNGCMVCGQRIPDWLERRPRQNVRESTCFGLATDLRKRIERWTS